MAKSKKTKKAPKVSVARILGLCLLGLLAIGAVANVIIDLPKEDEPIEETPNEETPNEETPNGKNLSSVVIYDYYDPEYEEFTSVTITFETGMTWAEWLNSGFNNLQLEVSDGKIGLYDKPEVLYQSSGEDVLLTDIIDSTISYEFTI